MITNKAIPVLHFDGACGPQNPGGACGWGFWVGDYSHEKILYNKFGCTQPHPENSNNVAEYRAIAEGLHYCLDAGILTLHVRGDSKLVIMQLSGVWKIQKGFYLKLARQAQELVQKFESITFEWVPREQNTYADKLSKAGLALALNQRVKLFPNVDM